MGKCKRGQSGKKEFPERFAGRKATTGKGSGGVHQNSHGVRPKAGGVDAPRELVQSGVMGSVPTVTGTPGQHSYQTGGAIQVQVN